VLEGGTARIGPKSTCFTSTKVQILTQNARLESAHHAAALFLRDKIENPTLLAAAAALLAQKYLLY
jgi:hypothetical protein